MFFFVVAFKLAGCWGRGPGSRGRWITDRRNEKSGVVERVYRVTRLALLRVTGRF